MNPLVFWNVEQATRSIERLLETAAIIYPGHDRPFRHSAGRTEYLAPFRMTVGGVRPDMEGIAWADAWPDHYKMPWVMPGVEQQTPESLG